MRASGFGMLCLACVAGVTFFFSDLLGTEDTMLIVTSSASIFDHRIEMMQLDPFRQFGPFFFTQTDHIELLHNHPSQLWPAAYWEVTYHACALR